MRYGIEKYADAMKLLPEYLRCEVNLDDNSSVKAEEIRLRAGRKASVLIGDDEVVTGSRCVTLGDLEKILEIATGASAYAARESIRSGYVTVKGGCRIGICGSAVVKNGETEGFREISSLAIRIPREVFGVSSGVMKELVKNGSFGSSLIVSPPGVGKTTLLRDMVRVISDGDISLDLKGMRVALADERSEIACLNDGVPQRNVGSRTDVMDRCPKAQAVMLLLRSMNPQVIALDEITSPEDIAAIKSCTNCGVKILATAHAENMDDLRSRNLYAQLLDSGVFENIVFITKRGGRRIYIAEKVRR